MTKHLLLALALVLAASSMLPAQPPPPPFGMLRDLDLTEGQRQSIQAIFEKHRAAHTGGQQALEAKEQGLMDAMAEPASTEAQLRELHAATNEARLTLLLEERATLLEIQALLSPAQQAKAKAERQKMQQTMAVQRASREELGGEPPCAPGCILGSCPCAP
jgi:Spy/CpxP family protein refolding chaperone